MDRQALYAALCGIVLGRMCMLIRLVGVVLFPGTSYLCCELNQHAESLCMFPLNRPEAVNCRQFHSHSHMKSSFVWVAGPIR